MTRLLKGGPTGCLLAVLLAVWALLAHPDAPTGTATAGAVALGVVAWMLGGVLTRLHPAAPALVAAGVAGVAVLSGAPDSLTGVALAAPLGYSNANAALLVAGVAGLVGAALRADRDQRRWLLGGALALTVVCTATESRAGTLCCFLLVAVFFFLDRGSVRTWQVLSGAVLAGTFALTVVLGLLHPLGAAPVVEQTVSTTRTALWSDALQLANEHPVRGIGPGRYQIEGRTARADEDLARAHSAPLQVAAELGWTGWALLALLAAWLITALGREAILFAVMALQPMVDYTLRFPLVVALSGLVLGALAAAGAGGVRTPAVGARRAR